MRTAAIWFFPWVAALALGGLLCAAWAAHDDCAYCHYAGPAPAESTVCLACHDELIAPAATLHPVGVLYQGPELHMPPLVPVLLFAGRVECASCHDAHTGALRVTIERSELCLACHDK
jgi:predicted CXXCH cytochrome family protein